MITVTCAIIRNEENEVLIVQRGEATDHPYKWEFPGGKLAENETEEECIIREIKEELSMEVVITGKLSSVEHDYGHKQIRLIPFICDTLDELPLLSEHIAFRWVVPGDLKSVYFSEADVLVADNYSEKINAGHKQESHIPNYPQADSIDDTELQSMINNMISMKEADWIATSAIENPAIFRKLLDYSHSPDKKLAFHASWTLSKVCDKFPGIILPFLSQMVDSLGQIDNESTLRSFLRIISLTDMAEIDSRRHGLLADFCFSQLNSGLSAVAVKAYSMEILYRLSLIYPELATELSASIVNLMEDGSAGITSRGRIILKKLSERSVKPKPDQ